MKRRVSLIVTEQKSNNTTNIDNSHDNIPIDEKSNSNNFKNNNSHHPEILCESDDNLSSVKMNHNLSIQTGTNEIETCLSCHCKPSYYCYLHHHKIKSNESDAQLKNRKSLDDLDLNPLVKINPIKKGTTPLIGSLIYYKSKQNDNTINNNNNNNIPLAHEKIISPESHENNINNKDKPMSFTTNDEEAIISSDTDSLLSSSPSDNSSINKIYRHSSYPWLTANKDDEFNLLNSKITSHITKNNKKLTNSLNKERKKDQFNNLHYHIPGIDPELNSLDSNTSVFNQPRSNSTSQLASSTNEKIHNNNVNNRHRRRLTCAMIFTRPKVVEI